jgi:hypothetical protein
MWAARAFGLPNWPISVRPIHGLQSSRLPLSGEETPDGSALVSPSSCCLQRSKRHSFVLA